MAEDLVALTKARSMLMVLIATCRQTLLALEAADHPVDEALEADVRRVAERSEQELFVLNETLAGS